MDGLLFSVLLAQGISGSADTSLQIDASLAFEHSLDSRKFSELHIRASSNAGGILVLETSGASPNVSVEIELLPGEPAESWVPLQVDLSGRPLVLSARLDGADPQEISINFVRRTAPRFVLVGDTASQLLRSQPAMESMGAKSLPHVAEAYRQITALAVDSEAVAALDSDQLRSLLEYAGTCGRLLLIDVSDAVADIFTNRAACDGIFLKVLGEREDPASAFVRLIEQANFLPPSVQQLEKLVGDGQGNSFVRGQLIILWAGYLFLLVVLLIKARIRFAALTFSVVATVLVVAVWPAATSSSFVAWAEMASNDKVAQYVGLERHSAARHGTFILPSNKFGGNWDEFSGNEFSLEFKQSSGDQHIRWHATPFEKLDHLTHGSFPVDTTLQLQQGVDSASICNFGGDTTAPMYLQWKENIYELTSIEAGSHWSTDDHTSLQTGSTLAPELKLFLQRSVGHRLTLLQSLPVPAAASGERAWLLQYPSPRNGEPPCET